MLAAFAVIGVFLGIAFGVTQAHSEREITRAYLDVAFSVAGTESGLADKLADVVVNVESYNRATLLERLSGMEADAEAALVAITAAEPPGDLRDAAAFLRIAVATWRSGVSETRAGLLALATNPLDEAGLASLAAGLTELRVGDRAYSGFLSALGVAGAEPVDGPMPSVSFIRAADSALYEPRDLARRMFVAGGISPVDDVAISDMKLEPGPVGNRDGHPVLAVTADQSVATTITNRGNVDVTGVTVRLTLVSNVGGLYERDMLVPGLEAGASTQLVFESLPVELGVIYEVSVAITRPDSNRENDRVLFRFLVNPDG